MKCFDGDHLTPSQKSFNYSVVCTMRVVEQASGCLKGRWRVTAQSRLNDPVFASLVGTVCCGLHNICERYRCPYEDDVLSADPPPTLVMIMKRVTLIIWQLEERSGILLQSGFMAIILVN